MWKSPSVLWMKWQCNFLAEGDKASLNTLDLPAGRRGTPHFTGVLRAWVRIIEEGDMDVMSFPDYFPTRADFYSSGRGHHRSDCRQRRLNLRSMRAIAQAAIDALMKK